MKVFSSGSELKIKHCTVATITVQMFYLLYFAKMFFIQSSIFSLLSSGVMMGLGVLSLIYIILIDKGARKEYILIPLLLLYIFGLISSLNTDNYRYQDYIQPLQYFGIGLILLRFGLNYNIVRFFYLVYALFFIVNIITGNHPDDLFIGFSRNNISTIMIVHTVLFYVTSFQQKISIQIYPALLTVVISIWALGRSGIIVSILLLLVVVLYVMQNSSNRIVNSIYIAIFLISTFFVLSTFFGDLIFSGALERSQALGFTDSHRQLINSEYIRNATDSVRSFILGIPIYNNYVFSMYNYNLHNSYARLHAYYGVVGLLIVFIFICKATIRYIKNKNIFFVFILMVLLIRMSSDIVSFNGPFDPLVYFFLFNGVILQISASNIQKESL